MKREDRRYVNGAGSYAAIADEDEAYRAFVVAVEQIIAEESQLYWRDGTAATPAPARDAAPADEGRRPGGPGGA